MKNIFMTILTIMEIIVMTIIVVTTFSTCWYWYVLFVLIGTMIVVMEITNPEQEDEDTENDE